MATSNPTIHTIANTAWAFFWLIAAAGESELALHYHSLTFLAFGVAAWAMGGFNLLRQVRIRT